MGGVLLPSTSALAQEHSSASPRTTTLEEITVTARKREESLQEIPLSLSVFNADDIQAADLRGLEDVAELTPGFQFMNQGNQQPGRYNTQLQFRGLTTAQFSPSFATGALFIDGIYVLNGGTSLSLMDLERIEVIKGPQAAYFGRNTFGGAVNMITRDPNMEEITGELSARSTNRANNEFSGIVEVPVIKDVLSASLSGRFYDKRGHWVATDGGRMGNEETETWNGVIKWNATDNLEFKLRYSRSEDSDGAPAQGFLSGILNDTCSGSTISTPDGQANPQNYICGTVPYGGSAIVDPGANAISSNTRLPGFTLPTGQTLLDYLTDQPEGVFGSDLPGINDIGLERETERFTFAAAYSFGDYSLDVSYGRNEQNAMWIRDFDGSDRINWFSADPQVMDDESIEIRLTGPQDGRLRWVVGYNRYEQEFSSSGGGGNATLSCFASQSAPLLDGFPDLCVGGTPGILNLGFPNTAQNTDEAEVEGWFAAVDFDITDTLTLSLEGRLQEDTLTKGDGLFDPTDVTLTETYDDFLPRAILRWTPTEDTNAWISYSEGMIAGDFNVFFINADDREREQFLAADPSHSEALDQETLEAWEIGLKQSLFEGRGQLNLAAYHYTWKNIKGRSSFLINETCIAAEVGTTGCTEALVGQPKQILDGSGNPEAFFNARNVLLPGDATLQGVELEFWYNLTDTLRWQLNAAWIDSEYDDYVFNFVQPVAGFSQMAGNQTPRQPEWSGNTSLIWDFTLFSMPAYLRGDVIYQGETFVDESNLAKIEDYYLANVRAGIDFERLGLEFFITNLTDEEAWMTAARWTDWGSPTQFAFLTAKQGVIGSPLDKREFGLRLNYRF
jgi:iron complex outermembrane receptor protein